MTDKTTKAKGTERRHRHPFMDGYRAPGSPRMAAVVADVVDQLQSYERLHGLRKRARKTKDQDTLEKIVGCIVANLAHLRMVGPLGDTKTTPEPGVAVSLSHRFLGVRSRYRSPVFSTTLPQVLKILGSLELAFVEVETGGRKVQIDFDAVDDEAVEKIVRQATIIRIGPRLASRLPEDLEPSDFSRLEDQELIVLKAPKRNDKDKGTRIEYADTPETNRMRSEVQEINAWIAQADLYVVEDGETRYDLSQRRLRRTFNDGSFSRGGRLFGGFWQNMPKDTRRSDLFIDEEPTVELDFGQMALRLLYARVGATPPPGDLYDIPELTAQVTPGETIRDGIKTIINAAISSDTVQHRFPAGTRGLMPGRFRYQDIIEAIRRHHHLIADHFFTGVGVDLMVDEADLMVDLLLDLKAQGIVALPIHDAVLVKEDRAEETEATMKQVFRSRTGLEAVVTREN